MIGIFAGTFDPPTMGHLSVIEQARGVFDELHVLVGYHSGKTCLFSVDERLQLLKTCLEVNSGAPHVVSIFETTTAGFAPVGGFETEVKIGVLEGQLSDYCNKNFATELSLGCIRLIRGIRGVQDFDYESGIADYQNKHNLETVFFMPHVEFQATSSSRVKDLARQHRWDELHEHVSLIVLESLKAKLQKIPKGSSQKLDEWERLNVSFQKLLDNDFISLQNVITKSQVESMLDPFPYRVAVSDVYHLQNVCVDDVEPTGTRYLKRSCSLGPIIVDLNENVPEFGDVLIIEGKHRWLDARKRGEREIQAWVGDKAIRYWLEKSV